MIDRIGALLFRLRGWTPVPLVAALLLLGRPTISAMAAGGLVALAGEALRIAALRHLDGTARGRHFHATRLATGGPFRFVRHPVYAGNALLVLGVCVAGGVTAPWFLAVAAFGFAVQYAAIIAGEEAFLDARFPETFAAYRARVPRFLPHRFPWYDASPPRHGVRHVLRAEFRTLQSLAIILSLIVVQGVVLAGS